MKKDIRVFLVRSIQSGMITVTLLMTTLFLANISQASQLTELESAFSSAFSSRVSPDGQQFLVEQAPAIEYSITPRADEDETLIQIYFPLHDGKTHDYELASYGVDFIYTYHLVQYLGRFMYQEEDSSDGSRVYYGFSGTTLYLYGFEINNPELGLANVTITFDQPVIVLTDGMLGSFSAVTTNTSFTLEGQAISVHATSTAENAGTVSVPAGTFYDCIDISMEMIMAINSTQESFEMMEVWTLAPDVGKIEIAVLNQYLEVLGMAELVAWTHGTGEMVETSSVPEGGGGGGGGGGCFITTPFSDLQP